MLRAHLLESEGRRDEAAALLDEWTAKFPNAGRLWIERGSLALRMGEIALAVDAFERATLAEPQDALAYHSLRFAFEGYRRYRTERVRFESAVKTNPRDPLAHYHLALSALSVLRDEEALFHFTRALELDPRLSDAACGRARVLQRQGHLKEAEDAYFRALEIDPACAEAQRAIPALRAQRETLIRP
jgi:tetratricopeptide (TPR) repeat protein